MRLRRGPIVLPRPNQISTTPVAATPLFSYASLTAPPLTQQTIHRVTPPPSAGLVSASPLPVADAELPSRDHHTSHTSLTFTCGRHEVQEEQRGDHTPQEKINKSKSTRKQDWGAAHGGDLLFFTTTGTQRRQRWDMWGMGLTRGASGDC